jgi:hypothetical protein
VVKEYPKANRDPVGICQVGGHADCAHHILMPNGGSTPLAAHFLKCHPELNVLIRALKVSCISTPTVPCLLTKP